MQIKIFLKKFIPFFLIGWYHFVLAFLGAFFHGFPSKKMIVIGVTGTNGKSTVVHLATKIFEEAEKVYPERSRRVASISSISFRIKDKEWPNTLKMTMPGRFQIQKFLKDALKKGCQYAILEVTSEGIKQHRHRFIDFHTAVFTNLTPEHIEAHGSFEKYKEAKAELFKKAKDIHVVNLDDENAEYFLRFKADKKWGFGIKISNSQSLISNKFSISNFQTIIAKDIKILNSGIKFSIENIEFNLRLLGEFNIYNALAAICIGLSQNIDLETIKSALEKAEGAPGRMEIIIQKPFTVIVDYAHTPDSLEKVYQTIKNLKLPAAKIIAVFGAAGGGRDKWKRPEIGRLAAEYCDYAILTNEDPYDENPETILNEIASGFSSVSNLSKILDRREAIKKALNLARAGDIIIITGKGSEPWICAAGGKKIPWDDKKVVLEEFKKLVY